MSNTLGPLEQVTAAVFKVTMDKVESGDQEAKDTVRKAMQYLKNTQHGTTTRVLNVLESDKSGMDSSIYNNRQDLI